MEQNKIMGIVYKIILPDKYFYIGSTIKTLKERLSIHKYDLMNNRLNNKFCKHIKSNNFEWKDIKNNVKIIFKDFINNEKELRKLENDEILKHKNNNLILNTQRVRTTDEEKKEYADNYSKKYYEKNKEKYREKNECDICKGKYTVKSKSHHLKSKKHQNYVFNNCNITINN